MDGLAGQGILGWGEYTLIIIYVSSLNEVRFFVTFFAFQYVNAG